VPDLTITTGPRICVGRPRISQTFSPFGSGWRKGPQTSRPRGPNSSSTDRFESVHSTLPRRSLFSTVSSCQPRKFKTLIPPSFQPLAYSLSLEVAQRAPMILWVQDGHFLQRPPPYPAWLFTLQEPQLSKPKTTSGSVIGRRRVDPRGLFLQCGAGRGFPALARYTLPWPSTAQLMAGCRRACGPRPASSGRCRRRSDCGAGAVSGGGTGRHRAG
jgi:hypothetical protein